MLAEIRVAIPASVCSLRKIGDGWPLWPFAVHPWGTSVGAGQASHQGAIKRAHNNQCMMFFSETRDLARGCYGDAGI